MDESRQLGWKGRPRMMRMARASLRGRSEKGKQCCSRVFMFPSSQRKRHWSDAESLTALTLIASESNGLCQGRRTFCPPATGDPMTACLQTKDDTATTCGPDLAEAVMDCASSAHKRTQKQPGPVKFAKLGPVQFVRKKGGSPDGGHCTKKQSQSWCRFLERAKCCFVL